MTPRQTSGPGLRWMFHSTAMVPDYDLACQRLGLLCGLSVLEYSESTNPAIGRRGGMTWVGDNAIEIGEPIIEGGVERFVRKLGGGVHSVACQVHEVDQAVEHFAEIGVRVAARPRPELCFTDPRDTGGIVFQWSAIEHKDDPRFGAAVAPSPFRPLIEVTEQAFVGAIVDDPFRWAPFYASLLGTDVTFERPDAALDEPAAGVSLGDCTLALYAPPMERSQELYGTRHERSRTHLIGLTVSDYAASLEHLDGAGFAVEYRSENAAFLNTSSTGSIQLALVSGLLPNDPRARLLSEG